MSAAESYERVEVESRDELRAWLADNHAGAEGVWVVTFKKAAGDRHVSYDEVVEEALCFGWIDSVRRKLDESRSRLLVTPRKPNSNWSRANKVRIERLSQTGLLEDAGRAAVEAAKADGRWEALDQVEDLVEPGDLEAALDREPGARAHWDEFPPSARRGILEWILNAKRDETRAKRVAETASLAAEGMRANQWPRPSGSRKR